MPGSLLLVLLLGAAAGASSEDPSGAQPAVRDAAPACVPAARGDRGEDRLGPITRRTPRPRAEDEDAPNPEAKPEGAPKPRPQAEAKEGKTWKGLARRPRGDAGEEPRRESREASPPPAEMDAFPDLDHPDVRALRRAVLRAPGDAGLWVDLGNAYARHNRPETALGAYQRALGLDSDFSAAWNNIGGIHLSRYRYREALEAFQEAVRADPFNAMAHYNLGVAHDGLGHYFEALDSYQTALTLEPSLRLPSVNPNIVNNRHLQILTLRLYRDAGGSLSLPLQPGGPR